MGQYYRGAILNEEKTEVIKALCCYAHYNGAKLMEHSYIGNHYVRAYEKLLGTTFKGKRFVWVGDYAGTNIYNLACSYTDDRAKENFKNKHGYDTDKTYIDNIYYENNPYCKTRYYKYLLNYDTKQFVKLPRFNKDKWVVHPLPLLCADGNGRGGGDYNDNGHNDYNKVGIWAYNHIGTSNEIPDGFIELIVNFNEED